MNPISITLNTTLYNLQIRSYRHPKIVKIIPLAFTFFGILLTVYSPYFMKSKLRIAFVCTAYLLILAAILSLLFISLFLPPSHDMKKHVFKPGQWKGSKLFYDGDVPILSLDNRDPYEAGFAQGVLCGNGIERIFKALNLKTHIFSNSYYKEFKSKIPNEYLVEMNGLVAGYEEWRKAHPSSKKISFKEILLVHLLPESTHYNPHNWIKSISACTTIVHDDTKGKLNVARNLDWPSFGVKGTYSLIVNRRFEDHRLNTIEIGVPGLLGTVTGMNEKGLTISMNSCEGKTDTLRGIPSVFYNRMCLEQCKIVKDIAKIMAKSNPLGPYHLTVADAESSFQAIHFYQTRNKYHFCFPQKKPLVVLNFRYTPNKEVTPFSQFTQSEEREKIINEALKEKNIDVEKLLELPFVNNLGTMHKVLMKPKSRKIKVAFDNAFAGRIKLKEISTKPLFKKIT